MVPVPKQDQELLLDVPERILCRSFSALGFRRRSRGPDDQGAEDAIDRRKARVRVVPKEAGPVDDAELDFLFVAAVVFSRVLQRALVDKGDAVVLCFSSLFLFGGG